MVVDLTMSCANFLGASRHLYGAGDLSKVPRQGVDCIGRVRSFDHEKAPTLTSNPTL